MPLLTAMACTDIDKPRSYEPRLEVLPASGVGRTRATLRGTVTLQGNTEMPSVTFRYGKTPALEQEAQVAQPAPGDTLTVSLDGLTPGATYYWCMVASNGQVRVTSDTLQFATVPNSLPQMLPIELLSTGPTSMIVRLSVPDSGGEPLTRAGCTVREQGSGEMRDTEAEAINDGQPLRLRVTHLTPGHTYEVWGYAVNTIGESHTDTLTYTTSSVIDLTRPGQFAELMREDIRTMEELAIRGPLNGDDLCCLRAMMGRDSEGNDTGGRLVRADLTEADIVEGGSAYDHGHFTQAGVVGTGMFAGLDRLEHILLPASATRIAENALEGCTALHALLIPASVSEVAQSRGCTALERITVDSANQHFASDDGVLLTASRTGILWFPIGKTGDYTVPSTIESIGDYAFRECGITRLTLPDGLQAIGKGAFSHSLVEEVRLPAGLLTLPTGTFQGCTRLRVIYLGSGLELVSDYAFDGCQPEHIHISATLPPYCNTNAFTSKSTAFTETCKLHVPLGCRTRYRSSPGWKDFTHITEAP